MAVPILVVGRQRSGTTVYRNLLAANGASDCGETFHSDFKNNKLNFYWNVYQRVQENLSWLHPTRHVELFKQFFKDQILSISADYALVDVKYNALRLIDGGMTEKSPSIIRLVIQAGGKFLHITRENKLRVFASLCVAEKTQVWRNAGQNDLPIEERRVHLPPGLALESVLQDTKLENQVRQWLAGVDAETISYEAMFTDDGSFSDEALAVAERLLARPIPRESTAKIALKKQNPEALAEIATNFGELKRRFAGTQFEWMLTG